MDVSREHVATAVYGALQASRQQQLKQVQLPPHVYELARKYTTSVPWNDEQQKLVRFVGIPMLYILLSDKVGNKEVDEGEQEFNSLQEASEAVLRYPMNLLLAPNRPEFRRISLSTSFWIYHISRKFPGARQILLQMGYQETPGGKGRSKDLILKGSSSNEQILSVAVDLVILREELDVLKELGRRIKFYNSHTSLRQIISVRANGPAGIEECFQILRQYPVSFTESRPQHWLEDSYSHCWNSYIEEKPTSSLLARGLTIDRDGISTYRQSFSPEPLNLPSPIMSQSELKRLVVPTPSIHTPSLFLSPPAATERGTPTYDNHKPHISADSDYVYLGKNENNSSIPVNSHSHHSNRGPQSVIADSGVVINSVPPPSDSTSSLPQSPSSRNPPTKKPALSSLSSYELASTRMNGYEANQHSSNILHRDNIACPAPTKGWVCLKCYIWNSAGSICCKNASCHALAPTGANSSAPSSLSSENVGQYHMRHATSSPSFELDHPPFSIASNLPPKFHSSPDSYLFAPIHPAVDSPIDRDHLAIPASHNYLPPHNRPSPSHSPVPYYLPPYSAASSSPNDLPPPSLRYPWKCENCAHSNSMDMCGCPYCGELAPWIEP